MNIGDQADPATANLFAVASNQFVATVLVPFFITFLAIFINWLVQGGKLELKHAMIGSDLVVCFFAVAAVHFFAIYRENTLHPMDGTKIADLMMGTFIMSFITTPALLICVATERASHLGETRQTWTRLGINLAFGISPLGIAAFAIGRPL